MLQAINYEAKVSEYIEHLPVQAACGYYYIFLYFQKFYQRPIHNSVT